MSDTGQAGASSARAALEAAERRLAHDPGSVATLIVKALALAALHRDRDALEAARAAAERAPADARVHAVQSLVLREAGRGRDALRAAEEAVRLAPGDAAAHGAAARALAMTGRAREAREAAARAVELAPRDAGLRRELAERWLDADPERAERHYRESLQLDWRSAAAQAGLARALERQGRRADAESAQEAARALDPAIAVARLRFRRQILSLLQASAAGFLVVLMLGWIPAIVRARWPAAATAAGMLAWAGAAMTPFVLFAWAAARLRRARREAPPSPEIMEAIRDVATRWDPEG